MRLGRAVPAGLVDAAFASLTTFVVGVYAAQALSPAVLGVYALFFTAFITAAVVPTHLVFLPSEIEALAQDDSARLGMLSHSLHRGLLVAAAAAVLGCAAAIVAAAATGERGEVMPLAVTSLLCTVVSPVQDHIRRTLHMAGQSYRAAGLSIGQLAVGVTSVLLGWWLQVPAAWVPFGALTLANLVTTTAGIALARGAVGSIPRPPLERLLAAGRWLTVLGLLPSLAAFVSGVLVATLAGAAALGYVEATRVGSQPLFVLVTGLSAVLGPRLMEAGADRDARLSDRVRRPFLAFVAIAGVVYLAAVALPWPPNPVRVLLPKAYTVPGLLALTVLVAVLHGLLQPWRSELTGAGKARELVQAEGAGTICSIAVSATAAVLGPYARPLSAAVQNAVSLLWYMRERAALYRNAAQGEPAGSDTKAL
jgi:O-antigen/teichoic acid export membrane protein